MTPFLNNLLVDNYNRVSNKIKSKDLWNQSELINVMLEFTGDLRKDFISTLNKCDEEISNITVDHTQPNDEAHVVFDRFLEKLGIVGFQNIDKSRESFSSFRSSSVQSFSMGSPPLKNLEIIHKPKNIVLLKETSADTKPNTKKDSLKAVDISNQEKNIDFEEMKEPSKNKRKAIQFMSRIKQNTKKKSALEEEFEKLLSCPLALQKVKILGFFSIDNIYWMQYQINESQFLWEIAYYCVMEIKQNGIDIFDELFNVDVELRNVMKKAMSYKWKKSYNEWMSFSSHIKNLILRKNQQPLKKNEEKEHNMSLYYRGFLEKIENSLQKNPISDELRLGILESISNEQNEKKEYVKIVKVKRQDNKDSNEKDLENFQMKNI